MKTLEEQFVPYQPSFDMKELGFDEPCLFSYNYWNTNRLVDTHYDYKNYNVIEKIVSAPLWQQAFDFFEEKYKLFCTIEQYNNEFFFFRITDMVIPRRFEEYPYELLKNIDESTTKKEAMLKAVLKLIEIVKNKK